MTKTQMTKLIKAVEERIARENAITGNKQKLVPAKNQEELRYPDAPTWNTEGKGYYDFHIVYWTSRDANTNKGGRVSMPSKDRWATFQITHLITDDNGTKTKVEKNNTVTVVDNVIKSIVFNFDGVPPPAKTALVGLHAPVTLNLAAVKSPKSVALPVDTIVTKSITLDSSGDPPLSPPPTPPLTELEKPAPVALATVISPKSAALPSVENVTYSILV